MTQLGVRNSAHSLKVYSESVHNVSLLVPFGEGIKERERKEAEEHSELVQRTQKTH